MSSRKGLVPPGGVSLIEANFKSITLKNALLLNNYYWLNAILEILTGQ